MVKELFAEYGCSLRYAILSVLVVIFTCMLTFYVSGQYINTPGQVKTSSLNRDYSEIPFHTYDATIACQDETRQQLGQSVVRTHTDWRSTRFEDDRQTYLVTLLVDVGSLDVFEEAHIYCYIDPKDYVVNYFQAYDSKQRPLLSKFSFGDLVSAFTL